MSTSSPVSVPVPSVNSCCLAATAVCKPGFDLLIGQTRLHGQLCTISSRWVRSLQMLLEPVLQDPSAVSGHPALWSSCTADAWRRRVSANQCIYIFLIQDTGYRIVYWPSFTLKLGICPSDSSYIQHIKQLHHDYKP